MTAVITALDELSALLGVHVVGVSRTPPAHMDITWEVTGQGTRAKPAVTYDGGVEHVRKERWWIRVRNVDGDEITLGLETRDIKRAREFSHLLRRLGSPVVLDNRSCRTALRLMHESLEARQ